MFLTLSYSIGYGNNTQSGSGHFQDGSSAGVIENKPGSQGSIKVYYHLARMYGEISMDAAVEGLSLYSEHTEDAENCPGKHPNVDRLLNILEDEQPLSVKVFESKA